MALYLKEPAVEFPLPLSPAVRVSVDFFLASLLGLHRRIRLHNVRKFIIVIILTVSREKSKVADEHGILRVPSFLFLVLREKGSHSHVTPRSVHSSQVLSPRQTSLRNVQAYYPDPDLQMACLNPLGAGELHFRLVGRA